MPGKQASARTEIGDLLRARRERLQPEEVGLPLRPRRRTPGLRREEVAMLASISPTYYAFLEQGRDVRPSRQVLDALAAALCLSAAERAHLYELAHGTPPSSQAGPEAISTELVALVDRLDPHPTYVTGRRWDVLAANRAARSVFCDWPAVPPAERNMVWWMFTGSEARDIYVDWEQEAAALLARFRAVADRHPGEPEFNELIDRLHRASPEVRAWWSRHEVLPLGGGGTKRLRHPVHGELLLRHVVLQVAEDPAQKVVTFAMADGDDRTLLKLSGR